MKLKITSITILSVLFIFIVTTPTHAYLPPDESSFLVLTFSDIANVKSINTDVVANFTILLRNVSNETVSDVTVTQKIGNDQTNELLKLIKSPYGAFDGEAVNYTKAEIPSLSVTNTLTNTSLSINYLYVCNSNFTINIDQLVAYEDVAISFSVAFLDEGLFIFNNAEVTYFDHWGDEHSVNSQNEISITVEVPEEDPIREYIPEFETAEFDYKIVLYLALGTIVLALFGRVLYGKKPFSV